MPYPHLGLTLTGEDAIAFDKHIQNPTITPEQREFFRRAIELFARQDI